MYVERKRAYLKYTGNLYRTIGLKCLPKDILIMDLTWDMHKDIVMILFSHHTLPEVVEGDELPIVTNIFNEYGDFEHFQI